MSQEHNINFSRTVWMERSYYIHHTIRMCLMDETKNSNVDIRRQTEKLGKIHGIVVVSCIVPWNEPQKQFQLSVNVNEGSESNARYSNVKEAPNFQTFE